MKTIINRPKRRLIILLLWLTLAVWLGWNYLRWLEAMRQPLSAIVVIGGGVSREIASAQLAKRYPELPIFVSGGSSLSCLHQIFTKERGIAWHRVSGDYRAASTLTNFTTLTPYLNDEQPRKVIVVTDIGGWHRAKVLGSIIFGSRGIAMTPALVNGPGSTRGESIEKTLLEALLACIWVLLNDAGLPPGFLNTPVEALVLKKALEPSCTSGYDSHYEVYVE